MYRKRDVRLTLLQSFTCSSIAGFTSKTLTAPFDFVKIRTQVGTPETRHGLLNTFVTIYQREGARAFWKGNLIGCLRLCPYSSLQLAAFQQFRIPLSDSCGRLSPISALVAGAGAGLFATVVMYPTDTIKTRLIVQHSMQKWAHYNGINHACRVILEEEGVRAFYRGLSTSFFGAVPYTATMFMVYETLAELNRKINYLQTPIVGFVEGCTAAAVAQCASYPFDTIRKKMQAYSPHLPNRGGVDINIISMRQAFHEIVRLYGISGLWNGLSVNLLRIVPYTGLMFYMYESCKKFFLFHNGYTLNPFQELHHPLVDQNLKPQEVDDEEDTDDWMISEED